MALTATATRSLRGAVCKTLGMDNPVIVTVSPDKTNMVFSVARFESLETTFRPTMEKLKYERINMQRTLIFCKSQETCAQLYLMFKSFLREEFTQPKGYPDLPQFRLVDMFMSSTHPSRTSCIFSPPTEPQVMYTADRPFLSKSMACSFIMATSGVTTITIEEVLSLKQLNTMGRQP